MAYIRRMEDRKTSQARPVPPRAGRQMLLFAGGVIGFIVLAAGVFLVSDRFAAKTAGGFPALQDYQFRLIDQRGAARTPNHFIGRPVALFFGFTYCPDVCPTTLMTLAAARDSLAKQGVDTSALQILFVTVDPARDTPEQLSQYLSMFDDDVTGLTGSREEIISVLRQFGIYAKKVDQGNGDYSFDHSAAVFLYHDNGRFKGTIVHNEPIEFIVQKLKSILS